MRTWSDSGPLTRYWSGHPTGGPSSKRVDAPDNAREVRRQRSLELGLDPLALLQSLGDDHGLREKVVGELDVEGQIEPHRALSDISAPVVDVRIAREKLVHAGRDVLCRVDRGVFRQLQVHEQLRPVGRREELLRNEAHAIQRDSKQAERNDDGHPARLHRQCEEAAEGEHDQSGFLRMHRLGLPENPKPEHRSKKDGDTPRRDQRNGDDGENREGVLARGAAREPDRDKPRDRDQCAGQHRKRGRTVSEGGGLLLLVAMFEPRDHRFDRDHGVVDEETERDDQGAQRDSLKIDPERHHRDEHRGEDERDREGHDGARA